MLQQLDAGTCKAQKQEELSSDASPRPSDAEGKFMFSYSDFASSCSSCLIVFFILSVYSEHLFWFFTLVKD